jgi:RimJ/RimL family protein N-acetyltransferase
MLKGKHVQLSSISAADLPVMLQWINDREQVLLNAPYRPVGETEHVAWFEAVQRHNETVILGIRLLKSGDLIGSCQLHSIHPTHRSAELQVRIGAVKERRHGYGSEAVELLLGFGFRDLNLHRVQLHVWATNEPALRMYEKIGFVREGVLRRAAHIDGEYVDVVVMGVLREEYPGR